MQRGPYGGGGRPPNNGGGQGDGELLRQLIEKVNSLDHKVDDMSEAVGRAATRDDLRALVPRDTYEVQQRSDAQRVSDNAARITKLEADIGKIRDDLHAIQLDDARKDGTQQIRLAQATAANARGDSQRAATFFDNQSKWLLAILAILGAAVISMLSIILSHPLP